MVITAPSIERPGNGPRPINLNKDIPQVLELLRLAFGESLDAEGQRILQGQTAVTGQPAFFYRFNPMASRLSRGFVWEKDGKIIGNVTLLNTTVNGRYLIVNVAVHPDYRRRGIARLLMNATTDQVRQQNGREILLQVDKDNKHAIDLYQELGYQTLGTMTTWMASAGHTHAIQSHANIPIREMRGNEGQAVYELDVLALPPNLNWPEPIAKDTYQFSMWRRLSNFMNARHHETWITSDGRHLTGSVTLWSEWGRAHQLTLRIHPNWQGELERPLLAKIIRQLPYIPRRNVRIDHPHNDELTSTLLTEANFKPRRILTHMRADLTKT
ncbi:MAG: GNAT family N-acetyltransferase [Anaerolineae bacterium]|nr:GNAT family N-acetyltransferase [Anaerolineae bacterium]